MGENIVMICHIYGAIATFLLFYDDQDTLSTECEIKWKFINEYSPLN